jgi:hypothetical protein
LYYAFTADTDLTTKPKRVSAIHCSAGTAAVVNLRNGSVSGDIVVQLRIPANESKEVRYGPPRGLVFPAGLFVDVVSGTVVGSVDLI